VPVVRNANGEKLSKQTGALAVRPGDEGAAVAALCEAAGFLGLDVAAGSLDEFWRIAIPAWAGLIGRVGI
jgi:glutamyl-Q tRNA(Asp) synthetase